jgi:GT2 family glycosyltransferase
MSQMVHVLVLNYNGRRLLAECLPSVVRAAEGSRHECEVVVIDNDSTDDSLPWLQKHFPAVRVVRLPNRGLCSFNDVVAELEGPTAVLLNNDIKLKPDCLDPLIGPLATDPKCFMTAPLCRRTDDGAYEGFKTAVCWRWGLVQATALYPGHAPAIERSGLTASAGATLAVNCRKFVELGGFDPLYLPGRLEDLDFALRGYLAGYHARYVPGSVVYHRGMATFGAVYGDAGCQRLALRNTLLFQWKNLRHRRHRLRQWAALPVRLAYDMCRAPWQPREHRLMFSRALLEALAKRKELRTSSHVAPEAPQREVEFFRRFHPHHMTPKSFADAAARHNGRLPTSRTASTE